MAKGAAFVSLDSYKLTGVQVTDRELGLGSAAVVIELEYMGHKCAGKKIHEVFLKSGGSDYLNAARRFSKECHFLSKIHHPNIVQFLGVHFQEPEEIPILVMEFLPTNLTSCIEKHKILPKEICYSILLDIAQGLLYLHDRTSPIIHRDLSSHNILLTPILTAKIADLGVARIVNMSPLQVSTMTQNPGTLTYMPPEVMIENPHYNTGIDEFSYGVLTIQILCGKSPRPHVAPTRNESGKLIAVSEAERRKKYLQIVGHDHPLMNLILKCVDNDPKLRPSAKRIVQELKDKVDAATPSFKDRLEKMRFIAEREAEKGKEKRNFELLKKSSEQKKSVVNIPNFCTWITILIAAFIAIIGYNAQNIMCVPRGFNLGEHAQDFVNATFSECAVKETIICDTLVPNIIHDLIGNISWKNSKNLQTTMYQGRSVVINDKMYYGGGFADNEVHKYFVYRYDPQLDNWTKLAGLPVKSFGLGKFNGKLIAVGGITMEGEESKKVYTYDEISHSWTSVIPDMPISRTFPAVLSLSSALVIAGGENSIGIYTQEKGWYWSNQPLSVPCTDVTLAVAGNTCYALAGNYTKEPLQSDWFPLSIYVSIDDLLCDRDEVKQGTAYKNRNELIYPGYRWRDLPGGFSTQANSLVGTVFASNLVTLGRRSQPWNGTIRMYSFTKQSWTQIGQLPEGVHVGSATITALSSTVLLVTGKNQDGLLSVYIGSIQLFQ